MMRVPNKLRVRRGPMGTSDRDGNNGLFLIPNNNKASSLILKVIASDGGEWEHVSVSLPSRCPTWGEMSFVKKLFWEPFDCVVQYHPREEDYVNNHPFCLHLWRPTGVEMPTPPGWMVGSKALGTLA